MENDDTLWPPLTNGKGRKEKKKKKFCFILEIQINIFVLFSKKDKYDIKRPYIMEKTSRD